jgi:hypothetical protein
MKEVELRKKFMIGPKPHCFRCGTSMKPRAIRLGGISVRAWRCPKDGEEILHPDDAELALTLNKLRRQGVKVKIGILNKAPYIRFPKEFGRILVKGDEVIVKVVSAKAFTIDIVRHRPS